MKPNILNRDWKYIPAAQTNIKATFARIRREMKAVKPNVAPSNVAPLKQRVA